MKEGGTVILRVEVTEPADFTVKEDNNLSLIEYELVNVVEE